MSSGTRPLHRAQVTVAERPFCPSESEDERKRKQRDTHTTNACTCTSAHTNTHTTSALPASQAVQTEQLAGTDEQRRWRRRRTSQEGGGNASAPAKAWGVGAVWGFTRAERAPSPGLEKRSEPCFCTDDLCYGKYSIHLAVASKCCVLTSAVSEWASLKRLPVLL